MKIAKESFIVVKKTFRSEIINTTTAAVEAVAEAAVAVTVAAGIAATEAIKDAVCWSSKREINQQN